MFDGSLEIVKKKNHDLKMYEVLSLDTNIYYFGLSFKRKKKIVIVKNIYLAHLSQRQKWAILIAKYCCTRSIDLSV